MTEETLKKAASIKATEMTISIWIDAENNKKEGFVVRQFGEIFPDEEYLSQVKKEIAIATLKILRKHLSIKQQEFEKIK